MNVRELRYLVALAERGHFGRAAEDCHVSQPTLSAQLRKLEEYLGVTLIERNSRAVGLTPAGEEAVRRARLILSEVDALLRVRRRLLGPLTDPLRLGVIPTLAPYFLPWVIARTKERYPHLQLTIQEDVTNELQSLLRTYRIDAAIMVVPAEDGFEYTELFDEPFWFACPSQHPLARSTCVSGGDLRNERLLLLTEGHCLRGQALAACGQHETGPESDDFTAVSLETLLQLVAAGYGCTLLPALACDAARLSQLPVAVLPITSEHASRRIGLVWRRNSSRSEGLQRLARLVRDDPPAGTGRIDHVTAGPAQNDASQQALSA